MKMVQIKQLKESLSSKIANILRHEIYENKIKAGDHLNEVAIAAKFGISRGPLRDAILILENEGLVTTPSNGRTVVIGFSQKEINEYYGLRFFLESEAIKKILAQPEDKLYREWISYLEKILEQTKKYLKENDEESFRDADYRFHLEIHKRADDTISMQVWKMLANISKTIMEMKSKKYLADDYSSELISTYSYHDKIFLSLKNRDLDMAIENLKMHLQKGKETFLKIINSYADGKKN